MLFRYPQITIQWLWSLGTVSNMSMTYAGALWVPFSIVKVIEFDDEVGIYHWLRLIQHTGKQAHNENFESLSPSLERV